MERFAQLLLGGRTLAGGNAGDREGREEPLALELEHIGPSRANALLDDRRIADDLTPRRRIKCLRRHSLQSPCRP